MLWATAVVALHAAVVALVLTGALVALRRPRILLVAAPVAVAVVAVHLAGAPCPLTVLELALRERAGLAPYADGYLGHYLLGPVGLDVDDPAVRLGVYLAVALPNLFGYGLLAARALRRRRVSAPVRSPASP